MVPGELEVGLGTWEWRVLNVQWRMGSRELGEGSAGGDSGLGTGDWGPVGLMN